MSNQTGKYDVHDAINDVMAQVGYVQKERAPELKYSFAGEAALIQALRPAMVEHGLYVHPTGVTPITNEAYVTKGGTSMNRFVGAFGFRFMHAPSDTSIDVVCLGEGADAGDKACNKAMTGAYKYALRQTFCIETGDDPDRQPSEEQERDHYTPIQNVRTEALPRKSRPWPAETIEAKFITSIANDTGEMCSPEQAKYVASLMSEAFKDSSTRDLDRYAVLSWLTKRKITSTKQLTKGEAMALLNWLTDETQGLSYDGAQELQNALRAAMIEQGQAELPFPDDDPDGTLARLGIGKYPKGMIEDGIHPGP